MTPRIALIFAVIAAAPALHAEPEATPISAVELTKLKDAANYSDAGAQYRLGMIYLQGLRGVNQDRPRAESLLRNAALQGHAEAAYELGNLLAHTPGADGDQAMKWLRIAADKDLSKAQSGLADLYMAADEIGFAVEWFEKAAAQGNLGAKRDLGLILLTGTGSHKNKSKVAKNERRGIALLTEAAEKGDAEAQAKLGITHMEGTGVTKDEKTGLAWLKKSAGQGYIDAEATLGFFYFNGTETLEANRAEATRWFQLAADHGHADSKVWLQEILKTDADILELTPRAEAGEPEAQRKLGIIYSLGIGVPKNTDTARRWWQKASEKNDAKAQLLLSYVLISSKDAESQTTGMKWLRKAADQGENDARLCLGVAYADGGPGVTRDDPEALKWILASKSPKSVAQYFLGMIYSRNQGVKPDEIEAYARFAFAVESSPDKGVNYQYSLSRRDELAKKLGPALAEGEARLKRLRDELRPAGVKEKPDTPAGK